MYKEMAAHESTRNTKLSDKKRLTRDEVDGISIDRHNRFFTYMRVQLSTTFLRSVLRTWVGEEQCSPWGPGRFCIAASAAASPYMRSGPTGGPHHNASCTRRCPGETRPT